MQYTKTKNKENFYFKKKKSYFNKKQWFFFFEDSLTFHPEFSNIVISKDLTRKMSQISGNNNLLKYVSQEELAKEFKDIGFKIKRIAPDNLTSQSYNEKEAKLIIKNFKHWELKL